jgi:phospholipid/cholesterol/gamma-HCH transport system substrate-binding protein
MNRSRLEWKVGLFLLLSLIFAAALIMKFSKGTSLLTKTYEVLVTTSNVGGIRPGAGVLMAGVQVGSVKTVELDPSGTNVTMHVQVLSRYQIHRDARVTIEQAGFLGDQYIAITPTENREPILQAGDSIKCEEPFNVQEVARSAAGLLRRIDQTAGKLDEAVARVDRTLLSEETLTNLAVAVGNFRTVSERALNTLHGVDDLVQTNTPPLTTAISNLVHFSEQLDQVTEELQLTIATNRVEITTAVQNVQEASARMNELLSDVQAGKGLVGGLLKDEQLRALFSTTVSNLSVVSSNLSQHGLLWRPPKKRVAPADTSIYPGKNPMR